MPEPLKNLYSHDLIESLSEEIKTQYRKFDSPGFFQHVMDSEWENKALKERMRHISKSLHQCLPVPYSESIQILIEASSKFSGFQYMFFPGFVELYGLEEYEESIPALEQFTKYSSSEFAIRPFIIKYGDKMMKQMKFWAGSENHHVRRLASEGCRPRLPWAMALPEFKKNPTPVLPILEKLKCDQSDYVRRSVANNLNDISKDNPQVLIDLANSWLDDNRQTDWIVGHACRTLLKQGQPEIMKLFGFEVPLHISVRDFTALGSLGIGSNLAFSFTLESQKKRLGKIRIEYAIDFVKKNGNLSRKLFKISELTIHTCRKHVKKSHSFREISTRVYYPGNHALSIIVNGHQLASLEFKLNEKS